jgi:hypothetical protein
LRRSSDTERYKNLLSSSLLEKDFLETNHHKYGHNDSLEYSPTSIQKSDLRGIMDTDHDLSNRSLDDPLKRGDNSKISSRIPDSKFKESKSPLSSRRSSNEGKRRNESPRNYNKHLGSPADNENIVYDKFVALNENSKNKIESKSETKANKFILSRHEQLIQKTNESENQISPIRSTNLAKKEISKLSSVNEENYSKELTPVKSRNPIFDDRMSPMRLPELKRKIENFSPVPFSQRNKSPLHLNAKEGPSKNHLFSSPGGKAEDEVLPKFEDFQSLMKDVDSVVGDSKKGRKGSNDRRLNFEHQSIQDTLRSIKELKTSPYGGDKRIRKSEMELDYSMTSDNFSRDENPLDDASAVFNSVEKY